MAIPVKVEFLAADPAMSLLSRPRSGLMQGRHLTLGETLRDGPISTRVAVLDLDPEDGMLLPGAPYLPPGPERARGLWQVVDRNDMTARDFQQVSVFGAIRTTMAMFEEEDVLGRPLVWAFDGPQLLVVPRAGRMANAFYHRASRSLQFFYFDGVIADEETTVYTCLSPDIVAHETAHAILDGIAPDLYDATSPQSLALHEAIADITAMLFAAQSSRLAALVLEDNGGDLRKPGAFNAIAEQFGRARSGRIQPLRDLMNDRTMTSVPSATPHALSEVLTGTLYALMLWVFDTAMAEELEEVPEAEQPDARFSRSGSVLFRAASRLRRIAFRALDYLPPGEISFADYARALIAADTASNPQSPEERAAFTAECLSRQIVAQAADLAPAAPHLTLEPGDDLEALLSDDAAALAFAERHRVALCVPAGARLALRPRLDVTKATWRKGGDRVDTRELILKVAWQEDEFVLDRGGIPEPLDVTFGTTLAIGWETREIRAVITNSRLGPHGGARDRLVSDRMRRGFLQACIADGTIDLARDATALPDGSLRLRGLGQQLHMAGRS